GLDAPRQRLATVDAQHTGRVRHRRDPRQQLGLDVFARAEDFDRLDARVAGSLDEILALDDEEAFLLPLAARLEQAVDEAKLRIRRGRDHSSHWSQLPWKSAWPANSRSPSGQYTSRRPQQSFSARGLPV